MRWVAVVGTATVVGFTAGLYATEVVLDDLADE